MKRCRSAVSLALTVLTLGVHVRPLQDRGTKGLNSREIQPLRAETLTAGTRLAASGPIDVATPWFADDALFALLATNEEMAEQTTQSTSWTQHLGKRTN